MLIAWFFVRCSIAFIYEFRPFFYSHTIVQQIIHSSEMIYFFQYYYTTCFSNLTKFMGFFFRNRVQFMFKISLFKAKITLHECLHVTGLNVLKKNTLMNFLSSTEKKGKNDKHKNKNIKLMLQNPDVILSIHNTNLVPR